MDCRWSAPGISVMAGVLWMSVFLSHVPRGKCSRTYVFSKLGVKNTTGFFLFCFFNAVFELKAISFV